MTAPIPFEEWKTRRDFDAWKASKATAQNEKRKPESWISTQTRTLASNVAESTLGTLSRIASGLDVVTPQRFRSGMGPRFSQMAENVVERVAPQDPQRRREFESGRIGGLLALEAAKYAATGRAAQAVPAIVRSLGAQRAAMAGGSGLGAVEDIGTAPEQSLAAVLGRGAGAVGMEQTAGALETASQSPLGRTLFGTFAPDAVARLAGMRRGRTATTQAGEPPRTVPETRADRMLPARTGVGPSSTELTGPAIPLRGEVEPSAIAKILEDAAARAPQPEGIEVVSGLRARTRQRQAKNMRSVRQGQAEIDADLASRRALPTEDVEASRALEIAAANRPRESGLILRQGAINPQLLGTMGGAALGGTVGGATSPEGEDAFGRVGRVLTGAAVGAGVGRAATRPRSVQPQGAASVRASTVSEPPSLSGQQVTRAEGQITRPSTPTPLDAVYKPRSDKEWREFYERFARNPEEVAEFDARRVAGEIQTQQGTRAISDDMALSQKMADTYTGLELRDAKRKLSGVELVALRAQRVANADRRLALRSRLDNPATSEADKLWMQDLMVKLEDQSINQLERYTRDVSQTGRDLRLLRESRNLSENPADWLLRAERLANGKPIDPEVWANLQMHLKNKNWPKVQSEMGKIRQYTLFDRTGELWQTGLLTGFMRPVRDVLGNNLNLADKQTERLAATFFDRIVGATTGVRTADYNVATALPAMRTGLRKGWDAAKAVFSETGDPQILEQVMKRYDFERQTMQTNPVLRAYTTFIRKTLGAADALTSTAATEVALAEYARVFARRTAKPGTPEFQTAVQAYLKNPPPEMQGMAMALANEVTWQNSTMLGKMAGGIRTAESALTRFFGKLTVPFVQTPSAMVTQTAKGSPFGLLGAPQDVYQIATKMDVPKAQAKLVNRLAKVSVGSGWIALGYALADDDKMTTSFPSDDRERRRWELEGRTESAVKIGGTWVSLLGILGPQAQLMAVGAALRKMTTDDPEWTIGTATGTVGSSIGRALVESPMMQGVSTLYKVGEDIKSDDPDAFGRAGERMAETFVTGMVPQAVQQVARATDVNPEGKVRVRAFREPGDAVQTAINAVLQGLPGGRQKLPVRQTALGGERGASRGGLLGVLSPARLSMETADPRAKELWETGAAVPSVDRRKGESAAAYSLRAEAMGRAASQAVERAMQTPNYQALSQMNTAQLRETLSALAGRGEMQAEQVAQLGQLSDNDLRRRLQGVYLERVIRQYRTRAARQFPDPSAGRQAQMLNALTRN